MSNRTLTDIRPTRLLGGLGRVRSRQLRLLEQPYPTMLELDTLS